MFMKKNTLRVAKIFSFSLVFFWGILASAENFPASPEFKRGDVPASLLKTSPKMRKESTHVVMWLENVHYLKMPLSELDIREFIREYMQNLDFVKMFFLAGDVQHYQDSFAPTMDTLLHEGVILPAFTIYYETFLPRAKARLDWIKERMEMPFDLDGTQTFNPDRSKETWPKTEADADKLWNERLKFDIIAQMLGFDHAQKQLEKEIIDGEEIELDDEDLNKDEIPQTYEEKFAKAKAEVLKRYERVIANLEKNDAVEIQEIFLNALANLYDPHTSFLSEYTLEDFDISIAGKLIGIGAVLQEKDGYCIVNELVPGGPAEKSRGLSAGDKIVGVGQETGEIVDIVGNKLRNTVRLIRGKPGTKVRLQVEPKFGAPKVITIVREEIQLTTKFAKANLFEMPVGDKIVPIGVIELLAFYGDNSDESEEGGFRTAKDVEELVGKLKAKGVQGIILDMRKNGGGLLDEAINLAGLFIRTGPILQVRDTNGQIKQLRDDDPKVVWDGPLIVLISRLSASASEIVAGALKNHERAVIVGDSITYGKGSVQAVIKLAPTDKKSAIKVTIQKWYTPNGDSIQIKGVSSDIVLPSILEYADLGEDKKDHVLAWDSIDAASIRAGFGYGVGEAGEELLKKLKEKSLERQATLPEFKFLNERIDWFKKRQEQKSYSLNYKTRENQLREDEVFADKMEAEQKDFAKENYKSEEILLDGVIAKNDEAKAVKEANDKAAKEEKENSKKAEVSEKSDDNSTEEKSAKPKKKDIPDFDVQMRESLRIMEDWISLAKELKKN